MELGKRIDHDLGKFPVRLRVATSAEDLGHGAPDDDAIEAVHDQEVGTENRRIVAEEVRLRGVGELLPQDRKCAVLALHIVCALRDGAERRSPQHVFVRRPARGIAEFQQVGEIRVPAAELADAHRELTARNAVAQVLGDHGFVEALVLANLDDVFVAGVVGAGDLRTLVLDVR